MDILIADDDEKILERVSSALIQHGHRTYLAKDGQKALKTMAETYVDLVLTDHFMPMVDGIDLIKLGKEQSCDTRFILMTGDGSIKNAVKAMKEGAEDYLLKPFNLDVLLQKINKVESSLHAQVDQSIRINNAQGTSTLLGESRNIQNARKFVQQVSKVDSPILILGPSGSGKEVLAKSIHESGLRVKYPFVPINCPNLNEQLLESALFGHEKGAFTGADQTKIGSFELAKNGTIFLDEIGDLNLNVQAKLLRVLEENEFSRVGGTQYIKNSARIIAATNCSLEDLIASGKFREDLYFRLNVISFELLPLQQRREDVESLLNYYLNFFNREMHKNLQLSEEVKEALMNYGYPGNVRELKNILERLMVLSDHEKEIQLENLPDQLFEKKRGKFSKETILQHDVELLGLEPAMQKQEKDLIEHALKKNHFNQQATAKELKINRSTLKYKMNKYSIHLQRVPKKNI